MEHPLHRETDPYQVDDNKVSGNWHFFIQSVPKTPIHSPVSPIYGGYADKYKKVGGVRKLKESVSRFFIPPT